MNSEHLDLINKELPHIGRSLELFWGTKDFSEYVTKVLNDSRDGARLGLPRKVASAMFKLVQEHEVQFPQFINKTTPPWRF